MKQIEQVATGAEGLVTKRIKYQTYPAYQTTYKGIEVIVFNGSYNSVPEWYIVCNDLAETKTEGSYRQLSFALTTATKLIDDLIQNRSNH